MPSSKKKKPGKKSLTQTPTSSPLLRSKTSGDTALAKCPSCDVIFAAADSKQHIQAHEEAGSHEGPLARQGNHGFIQGSSQLHPVLVNLPRNEDKKSLLETYEDPILLAPSIVRRCGLKVGQLIRVTHPDGLPTLHPVVYSTSLPHPLSATILSSHFPPPSTIGTVVSVTPHPQTPPPAHYLWLEPLSHLPDGCLELLHILFCSSYICKGMVLTPTEGVKVRVAGVYGKPGLTHSLERLSLDDQHFQIQPDTILSFAPPPPYLPLDAIQGLPEQFRIFIDSIGPSPSGALLWGPDGSGKRATLRAIEAHTTRKCYDLLEEELNDDCTFEETLDRVLGQAVQSAPSIIFVPDIDIICPRKELKEEHTASTLALRRMFTDLARYSPEPSVLLLATATDIKDIDPLLLGPDSFGLHFELGRPTDLAPILRQICIEHNVVLSPEEQDTILSRCKGCAAGDLNVVFIYAKLRAMKEPFSTALIMEKFTRLKPAAMFNIRLDIPKVLWSDIGGMDEVKKTLRSQIEVIKNQSKHEVLPAILLYGPPGCSKTLLAKAMATEGRTNFFSISGTDIVSKYLGETQQNVVKLFEQARANVPAIIFFDELDSLCMKSSMKAGSLADHVTIALVNEIKKSPGVLFIGATNLPTKLNQNFLNYPLFKLLVPLPDKETRAAIFSLKLQKVAVEGDVDVDLLAKHSEGFSGAEVAGVCRKAGYAAIAVNPSNPPLVSQQMLLAAIQDTIPGVTPELLAIYQQ